MRWRVLIVAVAAVTAGCGGFAGGDATTPTVTPAPVPEVTTVEDGDDGIAPGLSGGGVTDVDRLARAHGRAVTNESYVWRDARITNSTRPDRSADTRVRQRLRVEDRRRYRYWTDRRRTRIDGRLRFLANYSEFVDGDVGYARYVSRIGDGVTYGRVVGETTTTRFVPAATNAIRRYLDVENATVAVTVVDGVRHYEVTGTRDRLLDEGPVENYTATAVVRSDGLVRSLSVTYVDPEFERRIHYRFEYSGMGETTVERPAWIERARSGDTGDPVDGSNATTDDPTADAPTTDTGTVAPE